MIHAETDRVFFPENPRRYVDGIAGNWKSIREGRWKLIEIPHPAGNLYELYDVESDPQETVNVYRAGDPEAARLTRALTDWLASFDASKQLEAPANRAAGDRRANGRAAASARLYERMKGSATMRAVLFDFGGTLYDYRSLAAGDRECLLALAGWAGVAPSRRRRSSSPTAMRCGASFAPTCRAATTSTAISSATPRPA